MQLRIYTKNNIENFSKNCTGKYNLKEFAHMFSLALKLSEVGMHHPKVQTAEQPRSLIFYKQ